MKRPAAMKKPAAMKRPAAMERPTMHQDLVPVVPDAALLQSPYSEWIRELYNSRKYLWRLDGTMWLLPLDAWPKRLRPLVSVFCAVLGWQQGGHWMADSRRWVTAWCTCFHEQTCAQQHITIPRKRFATVSVRQVGYVFPFRRCVYRLLLINCMSRSICTCVYTPYSVAMDNTGVFINDML